MLGPALASVWSSRPPVSRHRSTAHGAHPRSAEPTVTGRRPCRRTGPAAPRSRSRTAVADEPRVARRDGRRGHVGAVAVRRAGRARDRDAVDRRAALRAAADDVAPGRPIDALDVVRSRPVGPRAPASGRPMAAATVVRRRDDEVAGAVEDDDGPRRRCPVRRGHGLLDRRPVRGRPRGRRTTGARTPAPAGREDGGREEQDRPGTTRPGPGHVGGGCRVGVGSGGHPASLVGPSGWAAPEPGRLSARPGCRASP